MDKGLEQALAGAGWKIGDAADLLEMTPEQRAFLDLRVKAAKVIRERRKALKMSRQALAEKLHSTQPLVASGSRPPRKTSPSTRR